jgi:hypothetical protein
MSGALETLTGRLGARSLTGPSQPRAAAELAMLDVPSRPFDKPGLTKFSGDIVNLGHLVAARQAALRRGLEAGFLSTIDAAVRGDRLGAA